MDHPVNKSINLTESEVNTIIDLLEKNSPDSSYRCKCIDMVWALQEKLKEVKLFMNDVKLYYKDNEGEFIEIGEAKELKDGDLIILNEDMDWKDNIKLSEDLSTRLNRNVVCLNKDLANNIHQV